MKVDQSAVINRYLSWGYHYRMQAPLYEQPSVQVNRLTCQLEGSFYESFVSVLFTKEHIVQISLCNCNIISCCSSCTQI